MKSLFVISLLSAFLLNLCLEVMYGFSHSNYTQDWSVCLLNPIGWICANIGLCHRSGGVAFFIIQPLFWGGILFFGLQKLRDKKIAVWCVLVYHGSHCTFVDSNICLFLANGQMNKLRGHPPSEA